MTLTHSSLALEPTYKVSKWLKVQVLLNDLAPFFEAMQPFHIVNVAQVCENPILSKESFEKAYEEYVASLKKGLHPVGDIRFSSVLTCDLSALWALPVEGRGVLAKIKEPCIQIQNHRFALSSHDQKILPMTFGSNTISWGLQFSFPTLWQSQKRIISAIKDPSVKNYPLFKRLSAWMRDHTKPARFLVQETRINSSLRIDPHCLSWIDQHAGLKEVKVAH